MKTLLFLLALLVMDQAIATKPFEPNGCTAWREGIKKDKFRWLQCCYKHDKLYFIGGTKKERKSADRRIKNCVKRTGSGLNSKLMYFGVRIGGRWGWGSRWERTKQQKKDDDKKYKRYREISSDEKADANYEIGLVDCAKFVIDFTGSDELVGDVCYGIL